MTRRTTALLRSVCLALFASLAVAQSIQLGSVQGPGVQAGMEKIAQGLADMQSAASQKKQKFVDTAGNVYDVINDAAGIATNMVRNKLGEVFDVTNMAGQWLYEKARNYPAEARQAGLEAAQSLQATASELLEFGSEIGKAAKDAIPEFPSKGNMLDRNQWISKVALNRMYTERFLDTVDDQFQSLADGMEAKYCQPAKLLPSVKKPYGELRFPGGFKLNLHTTECEIDKVSHRNGTEISCKKPWLEFEKFPARYRSKHHTPVEFEGKLCKFEVSHGEPDEITLAVFDGKNEVDMSSVMKNIDHAMVDAFAEDFDDAGMAEFYRLLPELADVEADMVALLANSMPDEAQIAQMAMYSPF